MNLGPIPDFCVADLDGRGQSHVVTCSGLDQTGAVKVVRIGIGVDVVGEVELRGVLGIWHLGSRILLLSFYESSCVLKLEGLNLAPCSAPGLRCDEATLFCAQI